MNVSARQVHLEGFIRALCDYEPQAQCALVNTWSRHVNFNHCQLLELRKMFKTNVIKETQDVCSVLTETRRKQLYLILWSHHW